MLEIGNQVIWTRVIADAITKAQNNPGTRRVENWVKQIGYAAKSIETNPYLNYEDGNLIVLSERSLNIYEVDEYCDCKGAVEYGQICWHRVAKRLWENYLKAEAAEADAVLESPIVVEKISDHSDKPLIHREIAKPTTVGNIRF